MKFVSMSQQNPVNSPVKRCIDQQLEIFPLQPGTNPARPEGDSHRSQPPRGGLQRQSCRRTLAASQNVELQSADLQSADLQVEAMGPVVQPEKAPSAFSHWKVATEAWQSVQRGRAARNGAAAVFQEGTTTAISFTTAEQDSDHLSPIEQFLAVSCFLMTVVLLISAL
ncbi:MAG: hypothetical protein AAEJ04_06475 [Planctomycetota bacterium]